MAPITAFDAHQHYPALFVIGFSDGKVELHFFDQQEEDGDAQIALQCKISVRNTTSEIKRLRFAPDAQYLRILCASGDAAYLFECNSYDPTFSNTPPPTNQTLQFTSKQFRGAHTLEVADCQFSYDCKLMISVGLDNYVFVWDVDTQKVRFQLKTSSQMCKQIALDPLGRFCVGVLKDFIQVWRLEDGGQVAQSNKLTTVSPSSQLTCVDWSPDGKHVLVGTTMGSVFGFQRNVWASSEICFQGAGVVPEPIISIRFSPVLYGTKHKPMFAFASRTFISVYADFQRHALASSFVKQKPAIDLAWLATGRDLFCLSAAEDSDHQLMRMRVDLPVGIHAMNRKDTVLAMEERGARRSDNAFVETVAQVEEEDTPASPPPSPPPPPPPPPLPTVPAMTTAPLSSSVTKTGKKRIQPALVKPTAVAAAVADGTTTTTITEVVAVVARSSVPPQPPQQPVEEPRVTTTTTTIVTPPPAKQQHMIEMPIEDDDDNAEVDGDDGWESCDLELDADNDAFVLIAGGDGGGDLLETSFQFGPEYSITLQTTSAFVNIVACFKLNKKQWQIPLHCKLVRITSDQSLVAFSTATNDVYVYDLASGSQYGSTLTIANTVVYLELAQTALVIIATRDGRVWVYDYNSSTALFASVVLDPLLFLRGRPFTIQQQQQQQALRAAGSVRLSMSRSRTSLLLFVDSCCYAMDNQARQWNKILDPLRFLGSEMLTLRTNKSAEQREIDEIHRELCLLATNSASQQANMLFQQEPTLVATVAHLESHYLAAVQINTSATEQEYWLRLLFQKMSKDYLVFHQKARFWIAKRLTRPVAKQMLAVLARNRDYGGFVEEWTEALQDAQ